MKSLAQGQVMGEIPATINTEASQETERELARLIVNRLNNMCTDPEIRRDLFVLFSKREVCSEATANHSTIQVGKIVCGAIPHPTLGPLGLLNGLIGIIHCPEGKYDQWGHIFARYNDGETELLGFGLVEIE